MESTTEINISSDKKNIYIPLYTYDGVQWSVLEPSFNLPTAKSRLRSQLPDPARVMAVPDKYRDVRCGLGIIKLQDVEAKAFFLEFTPDDFISERVTPERQ